MRSKSKVKRIRMSYKLPEVEEKTHDEQMYEALISLEDAKAGQSAAMKALCLAQNLEWVEPQELKPKPPDKPVKPEPPGASPAAQFLADVKASGGKPQLHLVHEVVPGGVRVEEDTRTPAQRFNEDVANEKARLPQVV